MRIAYFDIETWDLSPQFGPILCGSVLSLPDEEMTTFRQDNYLRRKTSPAEDMTDDHALVVELRDFLEEHHITSGWYSKGFDVSHINTRLVLHGERPMRGKLHLDPIWYFRGWRGLKPKTSKLKDVAKYFGLEEEKLEVSPDTWLKARGGNRAAMDVAVERCESDVRLLRSLAEKALELELVRNITRYP